MDAFGGWGLSPGTLPGSNARARPKMEIICDGAPGTEIRPGIPRGMGCTVVAIPRDASKQGGNPHPERSRTIVAASRGSRERSRSRGVAAPPGNAIGEHLKVVPGVLDRQVH